MSKLLTITFNTNPVDDYSINGVIFPDPLVFRTSWSFLEGFEKAYSDQLKEIPKEFVRHVRYLVESYVRTEIDSYNLLLTLQNEFDLYPNIQDFRIPQTIPVPMRNENAINFINKKLEANYYHFNNIVIYPGNTLVIKFLNDLGIYEKVHQDLVDSIASENKNFWVEIHGATPSGFDYYNNLSDREKEIFAYGHAYTDVNNLMYMTLADFDRCGHFDFLDPDLDYTYKNGYYEFDLSTFYALNN